MGDFSHYIRLPNKYGRANFPISFVISTTLRTSDQDKNVAVKLFVFVKHCWEKNLPAAW